MPTIVGIDPSLTSLGLCAVKDGLTTGTLRVTSKGHTDDTLSQRWSRREGIIAKVEQFCTSWGPDLIVIEGPSYASKFGHPHDRSGLWWGIVSTLMPLCHITEVPPTCRMLYATGKGQAHKDFVLAAAIKRYADTDITCNDIADATILCSMGSRHLGFPVEQDLPKANLKAMDKVHW